MNRENKLFTRVLLSSFMIPLALGISSSAAYAQLVYSHQFENATTYCPGDLQYDDWLSFRASLPTSGVRSITISGSQDPLGRTCSDPAIAQQIADAMRDITFLNMVCDGNNWQVSNSCQTGCGEPDNDLVLSAGGSTCGCSATYNLRPGIGNSNWGGITGGSCFASTQTMTVTVEFVIEVAIDIKFCSDPNAFNCKKGGVLPVTIFGTEDFLVEDIDPSTLQLCTEGGDCTGAPRDYSIADRGDPDSDLGASQCALLEVEDGIFEEQDYLSPDGFLDLDAAFEASDVQAMLGDFCGADKGAISGSLVLTGTTWDGTQISSVPVGNLGIDQLLKQNK